MTLEEFTSQFYWVRNTNNTDHNFVYKVDHDLLMYLSADRTDDMWDEASWPLDSLWELDEDGYPEFVPLCYRWRLEP